mgnify:CR=1 FL=1
MSKDFAWDLFKSTGNVDAFMIMKNIENGYTTEENKVQRNVMNNKEEK